jgi:hypothetical protein
MDEQKTTSGSATPQHGASTASLPIDIQKLAEKVYQLLRAEARLARSRGETRGTKR